MHGTNLDSCLLIFLLYFYAHSARIIILLLLMACVLDIHAIVMTTDLMMINGLICNSNSLHDSLQYTTNKVHNHQDAIDNGT